MSQIGDVARLAELVHHFCGQVAQLIRIAVHVLRIQVALQRNVRSDQIACLQRIHSPIQANNVVAQFALLLQRVPSTLSEQRLHGNSIQ